MSEYVETARRVIRCEAQGLSEIEAALDGRVAERKG